MTQKSYTTNAAAAPGHPAETLSGVLERITFHNEENGYSICRLAVEGARDLVTVTGSFSNPVVGELLVCEGQWVAHREYGRQFSVERYSVGKPATAFAIEKYLGSGLIKGIGPVMAKRMVALFGLETLDIIESDPKKLKRVDGIGDKRIEMIQKAWHEQREIRNVMLYLQGKGVSATFAVKIYKTYGDDSIPVVEENPYRLAADIWGIGFKTADKIAQQLGVEPDSIQRLEAGLLYTLSKATDFGHLYLPESKLLGSAAEILGVETEKITPVLETMITDERVISEPLPGEERKKNHNAVYHPALYYIEVGLANKLLKRISIPSSRPLSREKLENWLSVQEKSLGFLLSEEQRDAVRLALENRVLVLTGGPGTGKTSVTNLIARAFEARKKRLLLVSPTGRAAKRLSEVTGREASTIHRILGFDPATRKFKHDEENLLPYDALIADEVSMLDAALANNLLKAMPEEAQIVLVGDSDQLPSVGPGSVLEDLLASGVAASIRLTQVFRQAQKSLIVMNAHRIRKGELPNLVPLPSGRTQPADNLWVEVETSEEGAEQAVRMVSHVLPGLGFRPDEVQVLSPMHRGAFGVAMLNELLQEALNPPDPSGKKAEHRRGAAIYRPGDRVIQLVNNYDKNVFNGDIGVITSIIPEDHLIKVLFSDASVEYDYADSDELQLAYALSIHKSQGSEYRAVVLAIHSSHYMMLQRNLLYTGLTRAREMCILIGDRAAVRRAVHNVKTTRRFTRLAERLRGEIA